MADRHRWRSLNPPTLPVLIACVICSGSSTKQTANAQGSYDSAGDQSQPFQPTGGPVVPISQETVVPTATVQPHTGNHGMPIVVAFTILFFVGPVHQSPPNQSCQPVAQQPQSHCQSDGGAANLTVNSRVLATLPLSARSHPLNLIAPFPIWSDDFL